MNCRHCNHRLEQLFLDLDFSAPSNAYLTKPDLVKPELTYPLKLYVCDNCWLVQTEDFTNADELFNDDYAYFSSVSKNWLKHAEQYSEKIIDKLALDKDHFVVEIASNDGYLLQYFKEKKIPCLGIEPTKSTASVAKSKGIDVLEDFFTEKLVNRIISNHQKADLIIANNVYAHVPELNDFTKGMKKLLTDTGTITIEFPHLQKLIHHKQFDTVYHEHFSYFSLYTVNQIFIQHGLKIFDVEKLTTHGGSLRIYGCHSDDIRAISSNVDTILSEEIEYGIMKIDIYKKFQNQINKIKNELVKYLLHMKSEGKTIHAYGAAAKGNTLLNYSGIKKDLINYVYDAAESKQGKYLPGSHIPILAPEELKAHRPDVLLILPWNISSEIIENTQYVKEWGCQRFIAIPEIKLL